jgi:hypothetical protein
VGHKEFFKFRLIAIAKTTSVIYDVKGVLGKAVDGRL